MDHSSPAVAVASGYPGLSGGSSSVSFAQTSTARNYVADLKRWEKSRLTGSDLRRVHAKAARLGTDCPYAYGPLRSVQDYLGPITPRPGTKDMAWNAEVNTWFREAYWDIGLWDASRKFTPAGWQNQLGFYADQYGDALAVFTEDAEGIPCVRMIPADGIDSPWEGGRIGSGWQDGVMAGLHHEHESWHVLRNESAPIYLSSADRAGYVVTRQNGSLLANWTGIGNVRGYSRLIPTGTTIEEMQSWDNNTHDLFKLASKIGMSLETQAGQAVAPGLKVIEGRGVKNMVPSGVVDANGAEIKIARYQEQFLEDGPAVIAPEAGQTVNLHSIDRDLPDISAMRGNDLERIAMCYGLPVQILFCIMSGGFNVTGPNVRLALGRAKTWRDQELLRREPIVRRQYARVIEWGLRTKQIPACRGDWRYLRAELNYAKNYTIDEARDVRSDAQRLAMGVTTQKELAEEYGRDAAQVIDEQVEWMSRLYSKLEEKKLPTTVHFAGWRPPWSMPEPANGTAPSPQNVA